MEGPDGSLNLASGPSGCMLNEVLVVREMAMSVVEKAPCGADGGDRIGSLDHTRDWENGVGLRDWR